MSSIYSVCMNVDAISKSSICVGHQRIRPGVNVFAIPRQAKPTLGVS